MVRIIHLLQCVIHGLISLNSAVSAVVSALLSVEEAKLFQKTGTVPAKHDRISKHISKANTTAMKPESVKKFLSRTQLLLLWTRVASAACALEQWALVQQCASHALELHTSKKSSADGLYVDLPIFRL
jgi:hypothetical protein